MQVKYVHHINILVDDLDKATAFYTQVLGLSEIPVPDNGLRRNVHLKAGSSQVHLAVGEVLPANGQHFAFEVDNLNETIHELEDKNVPVIHPRSPLPGLVFINDPAGNRIEIRDATAEA